MGEIGSTAPGSEDVKIMSQDDIQTIQQTELKDTFETVTAGVSSFELVKTDLLEEVTSKIITEESPKMDKELKKETTVGSDEQDVAEKDASELSPVTKSRTSSTSSGSSKQDMIGAVKLTETSLEGKSEKVLAAPESEYKNWVK